MSVVSLTEGMTAMEIDSSQDQEHEAIGCLVDIDINDLDTSALQVIEGGSHDHERASQMFAKLLKERMDKHHTKAWRGEVWNQGKAKPEVIT